MASKRWPLLTPLCSIVQACEFDAHLVDWDGMMIRLGTYRDIEKEAHDRCHLELQLEKLEAEELTASTLKESAK